MPDRYGKMGVYRSEVERVLERINAAGVTVHTINSAGLSPTGRTFGGTLLEFAERTGGTYFSERNDLASGVHTALDDLHAGYTLGFLVPEGSAPGVQVRTTRPRLVLRFRPTYELSRQP